MPKLHAKSRISRRKFIKLAAGTAAALPLIQACAPTATPGVQPTAAATAGATTLPATAAPASRRGGTAVMTTPAVASFDPHTDATVFTAGGTLFESLTAVEVDPQTDEPQLVGQLAESWEVAPDARSVVFNLRQGVTFHDGSDWNAEAAVWNLNRLKTDELSVAASLFTGVEDIEALDEHTIRLNFSSPNSVFPMQMSHSGSNGRTRMISQAAYEEQGEAFGENPVGTGPFRFVSWVRDDRVTLERNPDYWRSDANGTVLPYLDGMVLRELVDEPTVLAEMQAGTIHMHPLQLGAAIASSLANDAVVDIYRLNEAVSYFQLGFNAKNGPFAESAELRQAIAQAFDRNALVTALSPESGEPAHQFREPGTMGYNPNLEWAYDPEAARAALAGAGHDGGLQIEMNTWNREAWIRRAEVYQQMLQQVNITSNIEALEGLDWRAQAQSNEGYDIALWGEDTYVDPSGLERFMTSAGLGNWMGFELPEVDALFQAGLAELDPAKRDEIYQEAARLFYEAAYVVPLYKEFSPLAKLKKLNWDRREFRYWDFATWWLTA